MTEDELRSRVRLGRCPYCWNQDVHNLISAGTTADRVRYQVECRRCGRVTVWEAPEGDPEPYAEDITIIPLTEVE